MLITLLPQPLGAQMAGCQPRQMRVKPLSLPLPYPTSKKSKNDTTITTAFSQLASVGLGPEGVARPRPGAATACGRCLL